MVSSADMHPSQDGVSHINIFSGGKTELGKLLSNWSRTPFQHPRYGRFQSMEGFYFYIRSGEADEELRTLWGKWAQDHGRTLPRIVNRDFEKIMLEALRYKLICNPHIRDMLKESTLPLVHYYVFGRGEDVAIRIPEGNHWLENGYEAIRSDLQARDSEYDPD
jgi:hypothetical protein